MVVLYIAIRALSPAVNDPTTAVQVLDHLGETLRLVGDRGATAGSVARDHDQGPDHAGADVA